MFSTTPNAGVILRLVVDVEYRRRFVDGECGARDRVAVRQHRRAAIGVAVVELPVVRILPRIAKVLAHRPMLVELVAELIADRAVVGVEPIEAGLAGEEASRHIGPGVAGHAGHRHRVDRRELVPLVVGENGQRCLRVGLPGQRRRDVDAVVLGVVRLRGAVAVEAGQAVAPDAGLVDRPADIDTGLNVSKLP